MILNIYCFSLPVLKCKVSKDIIGDRLEYSHLKQHIVIKIKNSFHLWMQVVEYCYSMSFVIFIVFLTDFFPITTKMQEVCFYQPDVQNVTVLW